MGIKMRVVVECDYSGCPASVDTVAEVTESRIMDGALGEHMLATVHVLDRPETKGWKVDQRGTGKCRCPIHNQPEPKPKTPYRGSETW